MSASEAVIPTGDLSNRRDIPVTSFDFLAGAYRRVSMSRRIMLGFAGTLAAGSVVLAALAVPAWGAGTAAASEAEIVRQQRAQSFSDLGTAGGVAVSVEELVGRHISMQDTYRQLVRHSVSMESVIGALLQGNNGGRVGKIEVGYSSTLVSKIPVEESVSADDAASVGDDRIRVRVTVDADDLAQAAGAALAIRQEGVLQVTVEERAGVTSVMLAGIESTPTDTYARSILQRLGLQMLRPELLGNQQ